MAFEFDASSARPEDQFDPTTATPVKPAGALRKLGDLGLSAAKGVIAVPEAAVGLADIASGGRAGKAVEGMGVRFKDAKDVLTGLQSEDLKGKQQQFSEADGVIDKAGVALRNPSLIANAVAESVPLMGAGAVPARALLAAAPRVSAALAGAIGEGVAGAGSAAEGIRQETPDGLMTGTQAGLAGASGALTAGFGALGGKLARRLGIADVDTALARGSAEVAAGANPKNFLRRGAEGAVSEGLLEELPQSLSEQVLQNIALDKPVGEGMADAAVMGTLAGGVMGAGAGIATRNPPQPKPEEDKTGGLTLAGDQPPEAAPVLDPATGGVIQKTYDPRDPNSRPPLAIMPKPEGIDYPEQVKPSARMGIDPAAGPISSAAALAVDSGAHQTELFKQAEQAAIENEAKKPDSKGTTARTQTKDSAKSAFKSYEEAQSYITEQKQRGTNVQALPLPQKDGSYSMAMKGTPDYTIAEFHKKQMDMKAAGVLDGDILTKSGDIFAKKAPAVSQANRAGAGHVVVPVQGGFVVRQQEPVNVQDVPQTPEVPQAAPAISQPGQAPQAVGAQPAGPAAGVPAAGTGAVEAAGLSDQLEDALFKERDATTSAIENDWMKGNGRRRLTNIERSIYDAVTASTLDADSAAQIIETALENDRPDLAQYAASRAMRAAESMDTTPGVPQSSPKYGKIKSDLEASKKQALDAASALQEIVNSKQAPQAADVKAITAKQIPAMTDVELQQAIEHYGPESIVQPATKTVAQPTEKTSDQAPKAEQSQTQPEAGKAAADIQPAAGSGVGGKAEAKPVKAAPYSGNSHFAGGKSAHAEGKPRVLPSYFTGNSINSRAWYAGWDAANIAAPVAARPDTQRITTDKAETPAQKGLGEQLAELNAELERQGSVQSANTRAQRDTIRKQIAQEDFPDVLKAVDDNLDVAEELNSAFKYAGDEPKAKTIERILKKRGITPEYQARWTERLLGSQKPATVNVPPTVAEAFTAQMQKQKGRITRLKNEAVKAGSLEDKRAAQLKVTAAEATLRQMRLKIFDAEDAAVKAVESGDAKAFTDFEDLFPSAAEEISKLTGQNDELDAEMRAYEDKASGKDVAAEEAAAKQKLKDAKPAVSANTIFTEDAAAAARARLKAKLGRVSSGIDPETMMDGITLAGYHIEKGARTFAAYAKAMIDDLGDGVKPYLKSWYMGVKYDPKATGFEGMDTAATVEIADVEKLGLEKPAEKIGGTLTNHLLLKIESGNMPKDNPALKKLVEAYDGQPADQSRMKQAQEALESAIVRSARITVARGKDQRSTFDALLKLYQSQPNLNIRTSTSISNQAYSTPAPLAYLGSVLADVTPKTSMYEPTGGNGMLTINALPANVTVNELEHGRIASLKEQGFGKVLEGDALDADVAPKSQDRVMTNPPFGSIKDGKGEPTKVPVDGYKIGQIDHLIAARALETMKDDGKATLIIGANKVAGGLNTDDRIFFNWLYGNYNVTSHFELEGDLYNRQGAGWPVRVITINGRKKSDRVSPVAGTVQRAENWEQVYEYFIASLDSSRTESQQGASAGPGGADAGKTGKVSVSGSSVESVPEDGGGGQTGGKGGAGDVAGAGAQPVPDRGERADQQLGTGNSEQRLNAESVESDRLDPAGDAVIKPPVDPAGNTGTTALSSAENQFQVTYEPRSSRKDGGVLIPVNMKDPTQDALSRLEDAVGNIDDYLTKQLGYDSVAKLHEALMGLQVDSVASAIYQIEQGKGIIIADQTGIGKGRQAAAVIRWAERSGHIPVFVSVKPSLFTDMYGDLHDIGSDNISPFILNKDESIKGPNGEKLFANRAIGHRQAIERVRDDGKLPAGTNAVFMTYSQVNTENVQRQMLSSIADRAVFILDESHNAGGQSNTGEFVTSLLEGAKGVTYLSATYAKRPDNMPLYFKTDIGQAAADNEGLMQAMSSGGLPLQTVVSNNLVKAGQMFRRERSYDGVSIETIADTSHRVQHEKLSDETTKALRAIVSADRMFHHVFVDQMNDDMQQAGGAVIDNAGNQAQAGVDHTQFSSVVHNFVKQMLLGLKAQRAADEAIKALKNKEKPIIAVENTMGSFLEAYARDNLVMQGGSLGTFDYRTVLSRALARTLFVTEVRPNGEKVKREIKLSQLDSETRAAYDHAQQVIDGLKLDIPVSPIDWMRNEIRKAGFSVAEITGRKLAVDYSVPGRAVLGSIDKLEQDDKVLTTQLFNSGKTDALILNVAGSTGISLHASEKFSDQRQRHMIIGQAAGDINIFMQMLGRIHRTGQVVLPKYTILSVDLPTEKRPTAVLSGKMKSLNANTSSNTDSATSIKTVDMFNKYGDRVVAEYLRDNYALARDLGVEEIISGDDASEDLAQKVTGRLALQPIAVQNNFYDEVEGQYAGLMEYLNKTNQNDLEPRTFDYDAKETRQEVLFEGENKESPFGEDAIYGEYSIKAQGKAMTPAEIREAINTHLDGKNADLHMRETLAPLVKQFDDYLKTLEDPAKDSANATRAAGQAFMVNHSLGDTFRVDINGESFNAVVTNIRSTHKANGNPFSLSKIQVTLALNGALRSVTVPATQFQRIEVSAIGRGYSIEQLFKEQPANQRETAKIVTGNLLAAYGELQGVRGTIISFTKTDGTTEQGILLPKAFDFTRNTRGDYRLQTGEDALTFLQKSENRDIGRFGIQSRDGIVRVLPAGQGIAVIVPKSKLKGGKFFLDRGLIAELGDFVSSGSSMKATTYDKPNAIKALDLLMKKNALYAIPSMAEEARALTGDRNPSTDTPPAMFRGAPSVDQTQATAKVQPIVDAIKAGWKNAPPIVVAFDLQDPRIPERVRQEDLKQRSGGAVGTPEGFFYKGTVYLMSSKVKTANDVARVLAHETLGHYGLRGMFGETLTPILRQIAHMRKDQVRAKAIQYGLKGISDLDRRTAAEEVLAEMAQSTPEIGFVRRAIAAIRTWLRRNVPGFKSIGMTDDEIIRSYILPARGWVERGAKSEAATGMVPAFSRADEPFYSALSEEVAGIPAKAQSAMGWQMNIAGLVKAGKVKQDEVEWSGLTDWLKLQTGKVTKEQISEYLDANGVKVNEVIKGGDQQALDDWENAKNESIEKLHELGYEPIWSENGEGRRIEGVEQLRSGRRFELGDGWEDIEAEEEMLKLDDILTERDSAILLPNDERNLTKYDQYQLPGGTNYREVLLTLPRKSTAEPKREAYEAWAEKRGLNPNGSYTEEKYQKETGEIAPPPRTMTAMNADKAATYKSSHWDTPNVLAHIRLNDRTDADGKRVLFVEEVQSDWGQQGKKEGFNDMTPALQAEYDKLTEKFRGDRTDAENARVRELEAMGANSPKQRIPTAPFVTSTDKWLSLALKRVITMAAQEGYDKVAFVTGDQSAERYDLSKQVRSIAWTGRGNDTEKTVTITPNSGNDIEFKVQPDGAVGSMGGRSTGNEFDGKRLDEIVGKDVAERIMGASYGDMRGNGLKVGGEGMKAFYDKIVPTAANKLLAKLGGGKMETVKLPGESAFDKFDGIQNGAVVWTFDSRYAAEKWSQAEPGRSFRPASADGLTQTGFTITPAMQEKAAGGMPMFSRSTDKLNETLKNITVTDIKARTGNKLADYRGLGLQFLGGTNEKLPEGSFADPSLPVNTGANARMVVIDRGTEEVRFSRSKQAFSPAARSQATDVVERQVARIKSKWKNAPKIIVAFDMADERIPAAVRAEDQRQRSGGAAGTPEGFYYGGTVYLMSSQLKSPGDVQRVLFHETLGHFGLRGTFGDGLKPILQQIATFRKAEVDAKIKEYGLRNVPGLDREIAAEEVLAEMAQNTPEIGFVKRAIAMIRTWLRENGFSNLTLTDDEIITQLILPARAFVEQGGKPATGKNVFFSRGTNEPMTDKDVVSNQGGRSADDTTPGPVNPVERVKQAAHDTFTTYQNRTGVDGDVASFSVDDNYTPVPYRAGAAAQELRNLGWEIVRGDNASYASNDASHYFEVRKLVANNPEYGPEYVTAKVRVSNHGNTTKATASPDVNIAPDEDIVWDIEEKLNQKITDEGYELPVSATSDARLGYAIATEQAQRGKPSDGSDGNPTTNESTAPDSGGAPMFSRSKLNETLKNITVTDIKARTGNKLADYRGLGLQFLGGRQIVDLYGKDIPQLNGYTQMVQQMSADANEVGAQADKIATGWANLKDERQLAELMHDATLAQIDPAKPLVEGDNPLAYGKLNGLFKALSDDAKKVYREARDAYEEHYAQVREAIRDKIERSEMSSASKAAMLARMDNEFFDKIKGVYFPLARFGKYVVVTRGPTGVVNVSRAETLNEAQATRELMRKAYPSEKGFMVGKVIKDKEFNASRDAVGRGFLKELFGVLDEKGMGEELQDAVNQLYLASMPDLSWAKHGIHRKGTPGFSQDARRAFAQNMFHGARYLAKLRYADQLADKLVGMQNYVESKAGEEGYDSVKGQQVVDEINKRHDSLMNPKSNPLSTALTSFGFVFHMGLSPASAIVNLSGTAMVAYPIMGAKWGFDKAATALMKAGKEAATHKNDISQALSADEKRAYDAAVKAGTIDVTAAHDLAGIAQGEDAGVLWKLRPVMKWASFLFHHAERFNRQITFVAAYRLARETGANPEAAFEQATKATYDGHFDYAASNRPRVMQGNAAKVLLLFKQYGQNMVYTLTRQAQQAMNAETPEQRRESRKALAGLLVMHAAGAGVLGLPLVGTLLAAASMIGGSDDEPWDAEVALRNMLADAFGQKPAEVLARGLSRLTPWDISGRVGLDKLILPDIQEGLEGQRLGESVMAAALGPVAGIGINVTRGMQEISEGHLGRGIETMMPAAFRAPLKALRYEMEGAKDKTGVMIKDEVGLAGVAGQALGFSPSEVRNATEGRSAIYAADKRLMARRSELMAQYAQALIGKDTEGVAEAMAEIRTFNEKNPNRRINGMQLAISVKNRNRRVNEAADGVYLPKKRRDMVEEGRFAVPQ